MWFVSLDTETTGLPDYCKPGDKLDIIQLKARVLTRDLQTLGEYETKIKMTHPDCAQKKALEINHYSEEAWADAKTPRRAWLEFALFLEDMKEKVDGLYETRYFRPVAVGQNVGFDVDMIEEDAKRYGVTIRFSHHKLDTVTLSLFYDLVSGMVNPEHKWAESYSLGETIKRLGISHGKLHDAAADEQAHLDLLRFYVEAARNGFQLPGDAPECERGVPSDAHGVQSLGASAD